MYTILDLILSFSSTIISLVEKAVAGALVDYTENQELE